MCTIEEMNNDDLCVCLCVSSLYCTDLVIQHFERWKRKQ